MPEERNGVEDLKTPKFLNILVLRHFLFSVCLRRTRSNADFDLLSVRISRFITRPGNTQVGTLDISKIFSRVRYAVLANKRKS